MECFYHPSGKAENLTEEEIWELWEIIYQNAAEEVRKESREKFEQLIRDREKGTAGDRK